MSTSVVPKLSFSKLIGMSFGVVIELAECVCVCVCKGGREREKDKLTELIFCWI